MPKKWQEKICVLELQTSLKEALLEAELTRADVGVAQNGPLISVAIAFDPRILKAEFYRDETVKQMRQDLEDFSHRSAILTSTIWEIEKGMAPNDNQCGRAMKFISCYLRGYTYRQHMR